MSGFATFHDLKDASVFITGGGAGIGAALTEGFLAQGCRVAFVQRSDASQFTEKMGEKYGHAPIFLPCDISVYNHIMIERPLDIAIHWRRPDEIF